MACSIRCLFVFAGLCISGPASAAPLHIQMHDQSGQPLVDAVVTLQGPIGQPPGLLKADMDQRNQHFAPHVLAVHSGTPIKFPNSDNIRHQVYSFSAAKRFELRLYEGTPSDPVLFDKPGVVVLGCNIHDWMLGYVYVTDDPRFGVTDKSGQLTLDAPAGTYHATLWHPQALDMQAVDGGEVKIATAGTRQVFALTIEAQASQKPTAPPPSAFGDAFKRAAHETAQ